MLIIALGVLTLMAILGAAFASLIRLEKKATENFVDSRRMDGLLDSALDRVIAELQGGKSFRHYTPFNDSPWLNLIKDRRGQLQGDLANGRTDLEDSRVGRWEVFSERAGQVYAFKTKVIDCAAQINLNSRQDTLARMLDNLGLAIEKSERMNSLEGRKVRNPFYSKPRGQGSLIRGSQIVQLRQRLPGSRFESKGQLKQLIGPENFELVKDFVTVHSYEDPYTYKASDGLDEVPLLSGAPGTTSAGGGKGTGGAGAAGQRQPVAHGTPRLDPEPRCPINVNTAPEEVLIACLQGLAGRRVFPFSRLGAGGSMVSVDQNAQIQGDRLIGAEEEYRDVTPRAVFVYSPPLLYDQAKKIAQRIISHRKQLPFMAWRTNDPRQPGFEDFIDSLDSSFFPGPVTCQAIDPDQPVNRQPETLILRNPNGENGRLWIKGHGQGTERQLRQSKGLAFHEQYAWYYDMIKGVIKANANPNSRINRYNPNSPAFIPVDKSDLVWARDRFTLLKGHTTEFCFDANGVFEITTLGRIAEKAKGPSPTTATEESRASEPPGRVAYLRKTRSVVKVYELLRHTNQYHFENTFVSSGRTSLNDRKFVVTWPDPMAALTELASGGSIRDGRVELAGLLDGRRLETPIQQRVAQLLRQNKQLLLAQTFQDRDGDSLQRLQRAASQGGQSRGDEYGEALKEVLNAPLSRLKPINRKFYRRAEMVQISNQLDPNAQVMDPKVDKEVLGSDLRPDGLHMSLLTTAHLQARPLVLPSRQRIGDISGNGSPLVGASGTGSRGNNELGNVPYYNGGIAFWVKFDFDGSDPVFSGLIGCTQVIKEVSPAPTDFSGSEGSQFFIFKNSKGELRVVRLYYHQAFPPLAGGSGGGSGSGTPGNTIQLYPDPGAEFAQGGGAPGGQQNPIIQELDPKKIISRADLGPIDIRHFKAHEWHHIALDWNDDNSAYPVRLYLDFQEVKEATPRFPQAIVDGTANSWCRLNERQPRDGLQIGGIIREQGAEDAGLFKWFTSSTAGEKGGAVEVVAKNVKRILANATIDELVTYEGVFPSVKQYYGATGGAGYFSQQPGEYANIFAIAMPPEVDHVVLRSFDWTSYYPVSYTDSRPNSVAQALQITPIQCELSYNSGSESSPPNSFLEPWRRPSVANDVAGRFIYRRQTGIKGKSAELVYKLKIVGARAQVGNAAGGVVQTPVVDDVTLTYFLPSPRILFQEEDEVREDLN